MGGHKAHMSRTYHALEKRLPVNCKARERTYGDDCESESRLRVFESVHRILFLSRALIVTFVLFVVPQSQIVSLAFSINGPGGFRVKLDLDGLAPTIRYTDHLRALALTDLKPTPVRCAGPTLFVCRRAHSRI